MVNKKKAFNEFIIRKDYEQIKASVDKSSNFIKEKEFLGEKQKNDHENHKQDMRIENMQFIMSKGVKYLEKKSIDMK